MLAADVRCPNHPDLAASGTCARCGTFICPQDTSVVDAVAYCTTCSVRPDVDWVEAYRQSMLGKRGSTEWTMLFGVLLQALYAVFAVYVAFTSPPERLRMAAVALLMIASGANGVVWFLGRRIARDAHKALMGLWGLFLSFNVWHDLGLAAVIPGALLAGVASTPLFSVPSKLFFRMSVPREKVVETYKLLKDNRLAKTAQALSLLGLFVPPFAVMALICGGVALKRVDPSGKPPVGGKGRAIFALVAGAIGLVVSSAVWWSNFRYHR